MSTARGVMNLLATWHCRYHITPCGPALSRWVQARDKVGKPSSCFIHCQYYSRFYYYEFFQTWQWQVTCWFDPIDDTSKDCLTAPYSTSRMGSGLTTYHIKGKVMHGICRWCSTLVWINRWYETYHDEWWVPSWGDSVMLVPRVCLQVGTRMVHQVGGYLCQE